jgi:vitamin B12 transporter
MRKILNLLSAGVLLAALPAHAQSEDEYNSPMDQIIVTGARAPLTISEVGSATTIIGREEIERRQARYLTDLLRTVPGFSISHSGVVGSQTQVRVRGSEANHVLVLIDGIRANDPATGDEFRWEHLTTGNIERVEIVRGAQSSLWGSDAVAAVVHVITRGEGDNLNAYAEGGSNSTLNAGANGRTGGDRWSLSGGLEFLDTDGENISRTGDERDGSDVTTASASVTFDATDALRLDAGLRYVDAYSQFDPVDFFVTGLPTDGDVATESDNLYANLGGSLETLDGKVVHRLGLRYFDSEHRNLTDGTEGSSAASDRTTLAYQSDIAIGENRLVLALEREETEFRQRGEAVFGDPNQDQEIDTTSVIADFHALAGERFTWLLSGRYDDNSDFDSIVTGRLAMSYHLSGNTTLRSSIGKGQKNPTFTERFGFFPGQFVGNPDLKPEKSMSYDIGIDQQMLDGALLLQATVFHQDLQDEINGFVFDPVTFLATAENLDGDSERTGIELAGRWNLSERFGIAGSYTYTDSHEPSPDGGDVRELRRPRHAGSLSLDFRSTNEKWESSLSADYGGTRNDIFFPPFPDPSEIVTLDSYWLVDLAVQYRMTPAVTLFARGTNLLDEEYEQVYGYRTLGRAGYVGVRTNFGR